MGGRDTEKIFGDGRFVILRDTVNHVNVLYDREKQQQIEYVVFKYKEKEPFVYMIGKDGYTIINYKNGELKHSQKIIDFSEEEQNNIINNLKDYK